MKAVIQRVSSAFVKVDEKQICSINRGLLILLGVEKNDSLEDLSYMVKKISGLRIFMDDDNNMNLSVQDVNGSALVVSQFTLCADTRKGRRPSFINAADPEIAENTYKNFCNTLRKKNIAVQSGRFGAMMEVSLINDGPVTIILDSQNKK